VRIGDYEFLIVAVSNTKIDTVKLVFKPQD
jgi:hypothetical protein